eukprot:TRINITY_DN14779_c1_g2_i1.p3 TRINITY_DN14779_c1_g2~~TRINITY_DN14779_c1_g2_i1.p3  ORF type:complete len:174 (-),score=14.78 TRINITY_DN14779_c1_g2_i1:95-616(-)
MLSDLDCNQLGESYNASSGSPTMAQLRLNAYRESLDIFIHSFKTYRKLLEQITFWYDKMLKDTHKGCVENVLIKAEIAVAQQRQRMTIQTAITEGKQRIEEAKKELNVRLLMMTQKTESVEKQLNELLRKVRETQDQVNAKKQQIQQLNFDNQKLQSQVIYNSSWKKVVVNDH